MLPSEPPVCYHPSRKGILGSDLAKKGAMRHLLTFIFLALSAAVTAAEGSRVARRKPLTANVGVVSVGLDTYWKQCPGLYEDMVKKEDAFVRILEGLQNPAAASAPGGSQCPATADARQRVLFQAKILPSWGTARFQKNNPPSCKIYLI